MCVSEDLREGGSYGCCSIIAQCKRYILHDSVYIVAGRCSEQCPTEEQHSLFIVRIIIDHYELLRITTPYSTTTTIYSASRVPHFIHSFSRHLIFPIDKPPNNHLDLLSFQSQPGKCFASLAAPAGYTLYVKTAENKKEKRKTKKGFNGGQKNHPKCRPGQHRPNSILLPSPLHPHHRARNEPCARSSPIRASRRTRIRTLPLVKDPIRPLPPKIYTQQRSNNDKDNWARRLNFGHIVEYDRIVMREPVRQQ